MPPEQNGFSIIQAFMNFSDLGAEWVMWLMVGLGFLMIVITVERLRLYLTTRVDAPALARGLVEALDAGDLDKARKLVSAGKAMEERVVADALEALPRGVFVVEQLLASSVARERLRYDRFLSLLGTVGNNAPFVGLFGTVIGIILAFKQLGANPKGGLEVVGPAIAEALVATAVGLLVAIPCVALFNFFKNMLKERVSNTEFLSRIVLASAHRRDGSK
jgi:biopolymer transport protein ExbB/TolQ